MNKETGEVTRIPENEKLKSPWIAIKEPNPSCRRCKGKGAILDGNRKDRRHNLRPMEYIPCPDCSGRIAPLP